MTEHPVHERSVRVVNLASDEELATVSFSAHPRKLWKFVLIQSSDTIYLILGPVSQFRYHASLVDRFCRQNQIASSWVRKPDLVEVLEPGMRVLGGGQLKADSTGCSVKFYGRSNAYGLFDRRLIKKMTRNHPLFSGVTVEVDQP